MGTLVARNGRIIAIENRTVGLPEELSRRLDHERYLLRREGIVKSIAAIISDPLGWLFYGCIVKEASVLFPTAVNPFKLLDL
jgi:hypothetical protein